MTGATVLDPGTASIIMFGVFFLLLVLRVPVAFALGLACLPIFLIEDRSPPEPRAGDLNAYNLLHPVGGAVSSCSRQLMNVGGITRAWCACRATWSATSRRLAQVNVVLSIFFAGIPARPPRAASRPDLHRGAAQRGLRRQLFRRREAVSRCWRNHLPPSIFSYPNRLGRAAHRLDRRAVPRRASSPGTADRARADGHGARVRRAPRYPTYPRATLNET